MNQLKNYYYHMETDKAKEEYKKIACPILNQNSHTTKHNLNYRQYNVIGQEKALTQQLPMATAQNIIKIHNIEQQQIIENQNKIPVWKNNKKIIMNYQTIGQLL